MKKSGKVLILILSLVGLVCSVCVLSVFCDIPFITGWVGGLLDAFPWAGNVLAVYIAFIGLCFFALVPIALFFPDSSGSIVFQKGKGRLQFSKKSVESTIRYSFAGVEGIVFANVRTRIPGRPEKMRVFVNLSVSDPSKLVELTETVQGRIEAALAASLGITARSINIKVIESGGEDKNRRDAGAESRVI